MECTEGLTDRTMWWSFHCHYCGILASLVTIPSVSPYRSYCIRRMTVEFSPIPVTTTAVTTFPVITSFSSRHGNFRNTSHLWQAVDILEYFLRKITVTTLKNISAVCFYSRDAMHSHQVSDSWERPDDNQESTLASGHSWMSQLAVPWDKCDLSTSGLPSVRWSRAVLLVSRLWSPAVKTSRVTSFSWSQLQVM